MSVGPRVLTGTSGLVRIDLLGEPVEVPAGVPFIRVLQYLQYDVDRVRCDWSRYCFNNTEGCCEFRLQVPGEPPRTARACAWTVQDGLRVHSLPPGARVVPPDPGDPP